MTTVKHKLINLGKYFRGFLGYVLENVISDFRTIRKEFRSVFPRYRLRKHFGKDGTLTIPFWFRWTIYRAFNEGKESLFVTAVSIEKDSGDGWDKVEHRWL